MKYEEFLRVAQLLNERLSVKPLLFGSLGLEKRLGVSLNADDIDVLIPERQLREGWSALVRLMEEAGYRLCDEEEHEFRRNGISVAFASLENLGPFAGVDIGAIPILSERGAEFGLLGLPEYLRVYEASSLDGYRKNVKHKQDQRKIELIRAAMDGETAARGQALEE